MSTADADPVNATAIRPHDIRVSPSDLEALARVWSWERAIRKDLATVLQHRRFVTLVQPMFDLRGDGSRPVAYQALTRFPSSPRIPSGLWFAVAELHGTGDRLVMATALQSALTIAVLPTETSLFVHGSAATIPDIVEGLAPESRRHVVIQLPFRAATLDTLDAARRITARCGVGLAVGGTPGMGAWARRLEQVGSVPDFISVDLPNGLADREIVGSYSRLSAWCETRDITLIARRVEQIRDLPLLRDLGFSWAQGYALSSPAEP